MKIYGNINMSCALNSNSITGRNKHLGEKFYSATDRAFQKSGCMTFSSKVFRSGRRRSLKKLMEDTRAEPSCFLDRFFLTTAIEMIALIVDILNWFCKLHYPHKVFITFSSYRYLKKEKEAGLFNKYIYITKGGI